MRIIFIFLLACLVNQHIKAQVESPRKQLPQKEVKEGQSSKKQMQAEMLSAINELNTQIADLEKQLAEAIRNKENEETIKDLRDQIVMLKKQVAMMGGVKKSLSVVSEKTFQQAGEEEAIVPKKDITRINSLPQRIFTDAELASFIITVHAGVEKLIPPAEKTEALEIYNETKSEYRSVYAIANAATGCWMAGHSEKALYIMGRACLDDKTDPDNLNNYASFLTMAGAEQAALPILQWLNNKYPKNSTILNNMGQAWFGLGDMNYAKKYLESATNLYTNHSQANATMAKIYEARQDSVRAISLLKNAIKENYDPDKEAELTRLGATLTYDDLPPLNYPMQNDPLGLIPFFNSFPEEDHAGINDDPEKSYAITKYRNGLNNLIDSLSQMGEHLKNKAVEFDNKMSADKQYREEILKMHNTPAHILAGRLLQLRAIKMQGLSPAIIQLLFPIPRPVDDQDPMMGWIEVLNLMWPIYKTYQQELDLLRKADSALGPAPDCESLDMRTNAYAAKAAALRRTMIRSIKGNLVEKLPKLQQYIKAELYGKVDAPMLDADHLTYILISGHIEAPEDVIAGTIVRNTALLSVSKFANQVIQTAGVSTKCGTNSQIRDETAVINLSYLYRKELICEFIKKIETAVYSYKFECNIITNDPSSKIKNKPGRTPKGGAKSSRQRGQNGGPVSPGRGGPWFDDSDFFQENNYQLAGPLNEEEKDLSQFSIEYNRWGNLVGSNFQLNKEGTGLADPDSVNSGKESRWSWNAAGSSKKGFLHKLLINNL